METDESLLSVLFGSDNKAACAAAKELEARSTSSCALYAHFDEIATGLDAASSLKRNRALTLLSVLAKWDTENKLDEIIEKYLTHICDAKPITSRVCVASLPRIAKNKPELRDEILRALGYADLSPYADSMAPLIKKDIAAAIKEIAAQS